MTQGEFKIFLCNPSGENLLRQSVTLRIPSNINNEAPLQEKPMGLTLRPFTQKISTADLRLDSKYGFEGAVTLGDGRTASAWHW